MAHRQAGGELFLLIRRSFEGGPLYANCRIRMKAAADKEHKVRGDFYTTTIAPVNHGREIRFCSLDCCLLTVLFLEAAVLVRLFMAG